MTKLRKDGSLRIRCRFLRYTNRDDGAPDGWQLWEALTAAQIECDDKFSRVDPDNDVCDIWVELDAEQLVSILPAEFTLPLKASVVQ